MAKTKYIDLIKQIIDPKYISNEQDILEEWTDGKRIQSIGVNKKKIDIEYLFCRFHEEGGRNLFPFFSYGVSGLCQMADYLLFIERGDQLFVISIELKLTSGSSRPQLKASTCFAFFLIKTLNRLYSLSIDNIELKTLRICQAAIDAATKNKKKTKEQNMLITPKGKPQLRKKNLMFDEDGHMDYTRKTIYIDELIDAHFNE